MAKIIRAKQTELFEEDKSSRGSVIYYKLRPKFLYKRAHSTLQLLDCLNDEKLEEGDCYNFITSGDVDGLSFLQLILRTYPKLKHLIVSTWVMSAGDIVQILNYHDEGKIETVDFYLGEIYKNSYPRENILLNKLMSERNCGRIAYFRNHSKILAGIDEYGQGFYVQMSCNINTNPRTENACIQISTDSYLFAKEYFDGINSFK